ncbi:3730_t:CDS:1 [Paraglomus brasilianum]|uniref:3730_t:CDS:1 n=1 Tax=Paraglomus brasilianum TaxID=144538 RepID=A0A9N9CD52_9GLOM|nr:3730_t:CDS:1 [Paraglomus brasilianum]
MVEQPILNNTTTEVSKVSTTTTTADPDITMAKDTSINTQATAEQQSQHEAAGASVISDLTTQQQESEQQKQNENPAARTMSTKTKKKFVVGLDDGLDADSTDLPIYSSDGSSNSHVHGYRSLSATMSRTQQKLMLMRQHFLADDENYLNHPRNQVKLTKVMERINREYDSITMFRDPVIESLQRVFTKYAHDHPEVLDDDFGAGYNGKDWLDGDREKENDGVGDGSGYNTIR